MSERKTKHCSNCGAKIDVRAKICPKCGVEQAPLVEEVSDVWYLVPFFLGIIGGLIAWLVNKDRNPRKARNFLIFGIVWSLIAIIIISILWVAVFVAIFTSTFTPLTGSEINRVIIKVEYNDEWQGAYGDTSGIVSWSGNGTKTVTLNRPSDAYIWIVTANAQKMSDSSNTLTIKITKTDGTVLKEASTITPYSVAQISYTVD